MGLNRSLNMYEYFPKNRLLAWLFNYVEHPVRFCDAETGAAALVPDALGITKTKRSLALRAARRCILCFS